MKIALVAIAKNEEKCVAEWVAYHLNLGFDKIFVYDNESADKTSDVLQKIGEKFPVECFPWESVDGFSPQVTAYNNFITYYGGEYDWVAFFDLDEFLVVKGERPFVDVLANAPDKISAIGVNWLTFGSSGQKDKNYSSVPMTFTWGPPRNFGNNLHVKTILRPNRVDKMMIHNCVLKSGMYATPSYEELIFPKIKGVSDKIDHTVFQLNHYQIKSTAEFYEKIKKGRAGKKTGDPTRIRSNPEVLLGKIDVKDEEFLDFDMSLLNNDRAKEILELGRLVTLVD